MLLSLSLHQHPTPGSTDNIVIPTKQGEFEIEYEFNVHMFVIAHGLLGNKLYSSELYQWFTVRNWSVNDLKPDWFICHVRELVGTKDRPSTDHVV